MELFRSKFYEEATDLLQELECALLQLEDDPSDSSSIEHVFRAMHTIKGNSAMFGFCHIEHFTHNIETIYDNIRNGKLIINTQLSTLTLEAVDHLKMLLLKGDEVDHKTKEESNTLIQKIITASGIKEFHDEKALINNIRTGNPLEGKMTTYYIYVKPNSNIFKKGANPLYLLEEICALGQNSIKVDTSQIPPYKDLDAELCYTSWHIILTTSSPMQQIQEIFMFVEDDSHLEISIIANGNLLNYPEFLRKINQDWNNFGCIKLKELRDLAELTYNKQRYDTEKETNQQTKGTTKESISSSVRVSSEKIDSLMNQISELITIQTQLTQFAEATNNSELIAITENMEKLSKRLRETAFNISLIPLESILIRYQRFIRDASVELGKDVNFITEGTDTELDKTMIESLSDPIMHILRNSLDHGVETIEERKAKGKSQKSSIKLKAYYTGAFVHIEISDDGRGIDLEKIRDKAIDQGLIMQGITPSNDELLSLLFIPGFSTAKEVTELSGRGVGMDVVKKKIEEIRGEVSISSKVDKATTVTIKLPLTLSIIDGLLVTISDMLFIIPLSVIERIFAVSQKDLGGFNNLLINAGERIPYIYLRDTLGCCSSSQEVEHAIVVNYTKKKIGLIVDQIIGEYQAVLKPLGRSFKGLDVISGATILGDGRIALVFDPLKLIKSEIHQADILPIE